MILQTNGKVALRFLRTKTDTNHCVERLTTRSLLRHKQVCIELHLIGSAAVK